MFIDFEYKLPENVRDPLINKPQHQREWAEYVNLPRDKKTLNLKLITVQKCLALSNFKAR